MKRKVRQAVKNSALETKRNFSTKNFLCAYKSGADMWLEYISLYGEPEARGICNRYLDMQIYSTDAEEIQFCRQLYNAMQ